MSYIAPNLKPKFESLSAELKDEILRRDVYLYNMTDLIRCLEKIVAEE